MDNFDKRQLAIKLASGAKLIAIVSFILLMLLLIVAIITWDLYWIRISLTTVVMIALSSVLWLIFDDMRFKF